MNAKQEKYFLNFSSNLNEGVQYYHALFEEVEDKFQDTKSTFIKELDQSKIALQLLCADIDDLVLKPALVN